jgi:tRNA (guanine37-N1)-methyltransferase
VSVRVDVITLFPQMLEAPLGESMLGRARDEGLWELHLHELREWTHDTHRTVDDTPYGGGPGMVMKPEPVFEAVDAVTSLDARRPFVVFLSPSGRPFTQNEAVRLAEKERLLLVSGRYEGFDERVLTLADQVYSIGDYVLTGGEVPALVVIDATVRLIDGVLGHSESASDESFSAGLLEYPQYTRPASYRGHDVPEVLRSGDHARIEAWRRAESIRRTARVRPDLLDAAELSADERRIVAEEMEREVPDD